MGPALTSKRLDSPPPSTRRGSMPDERRRWEWILVPVGHVQLFSILSFLTSGIAYRETSMGAGCGWQCAEEHLARVGGGGLVQNGGTEAGLLLLVRPDGSPHQHQHPAQVLPTAADSLACFPGLDRALLEGGDSGFGPSRSCQRSRLDPLGTRHKVNESSSYIVSFSHRLYLYPSAACPGGRRGKQTGGHSAEGWDL
jgi:hypothetical protein